MEPAAAAGRLQWLAARWSTGWWSTGWLRGWIWWIWPASCWWLWRPVSTTAGLWTAAVRSTAARLQPTGRRAAGRQPGYGRRLSAELWPGYQRAAGRQPGYGR